MPLPRTALEHYADQQQTVARAMIRARRAWSRMGPDFDTSWRSVGPAVLAGVVAAQATTAAAGAAYVPRVLAEQGVPTDPLAAVDPSALVGVASDGRPLESLLLGSVITAKRASAAGALPVVALAAGRSWLDRVVRTQVADAGRAASKMAAGVEPRATRWVRMLNPPSCSRCVQLAGKVFGWQADFDRHDACDCVAVISTESRSDDLTVNPQAYFDSLSERDQDRTYTRAGAEAIRLGADMNQVVNARRGMYSSAEFGERLLFTREGVTRRGVARESLTRIGGEADVRDAGARYRRAKRPRLMPGTILKVAADRDDAVKLLRANGYVLR